MTRLVPEPDERTAAFWEAAGRHQLVLAWCARCGSTTLPPDVTCPACGSTHPDFEFVAVNGGGVVRSWTVVRDSFLPGFEDDIPFVLVDVALDDDPGVRLIGRLIDGVAVLPSLGDRVDIAFEDIASDIAVPAFVLTS